MHSFTSIQIPDWKRAVIKVGSALVAPEGKGCSTRYLLALASFIIESRKRDREIIVVSSGAVAAGLSTQPQMLLKSHRSIPEKQALAAIGYGMPGKIPPLTSNSQALPNPPWTILTQDGIGVMRSWIHIFG